MALHHHQQTVQTMDMMRCSRLAACNKTLQNSGCMAQLLSYLTEGFYFMYA